jgi:hypothetical protein
MFSGVPREEPEKLVSSTTTEQERAGLLRRYLS